MNAAEIVASLAIPQSAHVGQRIAKKLFIENAAFTTADKRRINDGVEELHWVAAVKPNNIGVPAYRDAIREYLEIAVLTLVLRPAAKADRMLELVHRAVPYPVLLVTTQSETISLSAANKRHAQNEMGKIVLDEGVVEVSLPSSCSVSADLPPLTLSAQPADNLFVFYQGWIECLEAIQAAKLTGFCTLAKNSEFAAARREALAAYARLTREITLLRSQGERETQLPRRVELNLEIKRLEAALAAAKSRL